VSSETVTISFADGDWCGMATSAGLATLFRGRELLGVGSGSELPLTMSEHAAGERWSASWDGADCGFDIEAVAISAPVRSEQFVRVTGTVRAGGESFAIDAPGQISHVPELDWSSLELVRYVGAWLGDGGIVLESLRQRKAKGHDAEDVWASLVEHGEPVPVVDPRLSTTYDGDGHQRRAGLELWMTEEEEGYPVRVAGEVICGSSLDLGDLQLDLAFFRWRAHGTEGIGRYDILRKRSA
jgi:hypothetical protein